MNLKIRSILIACLVLFTVSAFAQKHKKRAVVNNPFVGSWELVQLSQNGDGGMQAVPGLLKIYDSNGTFSNLEVGQNGTLMTHSGKYKIVSKNTYNEIIGSARSDSYYALSGKTYRLTYSLSVDGNQLTITGGVDGKDGNAGLKYVEVWHKLSPQ